MSCASVIGGLANLLIVNAPTRVASAEFRRAAVRAGFARSFFTGRGNLGPAAHVCRSAKTVHAIARRSNAADIVALRIARLPDRDEHGGDDDTERQPAG